MKQLCLLAALTFFTINSFAYFNQGSWRWYKDDGNEASASALAAEEKKPTVNSYDNIRLRIQMYNDGPQTFTSASIILQYTTDTIAATFPDNAAWTDITTDISRAFALSASTYVANGASTTQKLTTAEYAFVSGKFVTASTTLPLTLNSETETEYEFCIKPTAAALTSTIYYFRVYPAGGGGFYNLPIPSLITDLVMPVTLTSFLVAEENKAVKIKWSTASEVNNKYFEVLRSADGKSNWQMIATITGHGTSSLVNNYVAYDRDPLNGSNYYKLKQVDFDGKSTESEIKLLIMQLIKKSELSVFPNPVKDNVINFSIENNRSPVTVILTDMNGKVVYHQPGVTSSLFNQYTLNLKNALPSGVYMLQVKGNNFSQSTRVSIQ